MLATSTAQEANSLFLFFHPLGKKEEMGVGFCVRMDQLLSLGYQAAGTSNSAFHFSSISA